MRPIWRSHTSMYLQDAVLWRFSTSHVIRCDMSCQISSHMIFFPSHQNKCQEKLYFISTSPCLSTTRYFVAAVGSQAATTPTLTRPHRKTPAPSALCATPPSSPTQAAGFPSCLSCRCRSKERRVLEQPLEGDAAQARVWHGATVGGARTGVAAAKARYA